jgi:hypothetical protein
VNPPRQIIVAGHSYRIEVVDSPLEGLGRHTGPQSVGHAMLGAGIIRLRGGPESSPMNQRDSLLHEAIHATLELYGYLGQGETDVFRSPRMHERVIEVLGTGLLDVFRRNPDLVAYLMEGDSDAAEEGQVAEGHQLEHPPGDQGRSSAEAGAGDRVAKGRQAE